MSARIQHEAPLILARLQPGEQMIPRIRNRFNGFYYRTYAERPGKAVETVCRE